MRYIYFLSMFSSCVGFHGNTRFRWYFRRKDSNLLFFFEIVHPQKWANRVKIVYLFQPMLRQEELWQSQRNALRSCDNWQVSWLHFWFLSGFLVFANTSGEKLRLVSGFVAFFIFCRHSEIKYDAPPVPPKLRNRNIHLVRDPP